MRRNDQTECVAVKNRDFRYTVESMRYKNRKQIEQARKFCAAAKGSVECGESKRKRLRDAGTYERHLRTIMKLHDFKLPFLEEYLQFSQWLLKYEIRLVRVIP